MRERDAHDRAESTDSPPEIAESARPERIGPYRIVRKLGEGGMGAVYEAEQTEPVRRSVAVKVIKLGMDTRQVVERFEAERQALAVMDHPHIARMLDAGSTEDGRPYFVMELVRGVPVTAYADDRRLDTRARIRLFQQACAAVQHAHQKGIIHRDLKPSNILVETDTAEPVLKIIDFGIAKAIRPELGDAAFMTRLGQVIGSPAYMSPEQADETALDIDTRTDVYSLGVVLYELLTGVLPFDRGTFAQPMAVLHALLASRDVPRPSARFHALTDTRDTVAHHRGTDARALRRELRDDLDWIVMRAMEKERARRYDTPAALAGDLARYLDAEPVHARPPSIAYRTSRFARRHRAGVAAATLVLSVLTGSSIALALQAARLTEERDTAQEMTDFLENLFAATDPYVGPDRRDTLSIAAFVDMGARRVEEELGDRPEVRARLEFVLGRALRNLGRFEDARPLLESALAIYGERRGASSTEAVGVAQSLAFLLLDMGDAEAAAVMFDEARAAHRASGAQATGLYGDALSGLGNARMTLGQFEEAEVAYEEALAVYEAVDDPRVGRLAQAHSNLGAALLRQGAYAEAEPRFRRAMEVGAQDLPADHPSMLSFANNLAFLLGEMGRLDEAEAMHRRTLELKRARFPAGHPQIAITLNNLGALLLDRGDGASALPVLEEALELRRALYAPDNANVGVTIGNLGQARALSGDRAGALEDWNEALRIFEASLGPDHPRVATLLVSLADAAHEDGDHETARWRYERSGAIRLAALGDEHPLTASVLTGLGQELRELGLYSEAEAVLHNAHAALAARSAEEPARWRLANQQLLELNEAKGDTVEAARFRAVLSRLDG